MSNDVNQDPIFGPVIYGYSRAQAIEDGVLVEVPEIASRRAGFKVPMLTKSHDRQAIDDCSISTSVNE